MVRKITQITGGVFFFLLNTPKSFAHDMHTMPNTMVMEGMDHVTHSSISITSILTILCIFAIPILFSLIKKYISDANSIQRIAFSTLIIFFSFQVLPAKMFCIKYMHHDVSHSAESPCCQVQTTQSLSPVSFHGISFSIRTLIVSLPRTPEVKTIVLPNPRAPPSFI